MNKKNVYTLIVIAFTIALFVTPLGYWGKIWLMRVFTTSPEIIQVTQRKQLLDYNWKLKDDKWNYFNFEKSKGKVVFVKFWSSWSLPSASELNDIQELYDLYSHEIDFYIITNEKRLPVEEFMRKNRFTFKVTYLIMGEPAPIKIYEPPASYIFDKKGFIVIEEKSNADWDNAIIHNLLNDLISQ